MLVMWYGFILPRYLNLSSSGRNNQPWMCLLSTLDIRTRLLKDGSSPVTSLVKACFISVVLVLGATPAMANCEPYLDDFERLGKEYQDAFNKATALIDLPDSEREWCSAARVANSKAEAFNDAHLKAITCKCNSGGDCSQSAYHHNVFTTEMMKKKTEELCSKYDN